MDYYVKVFEWIAWILFKQNDIEMVAERQTRCVAAQSWNPETPYRTWASNKKGKKIFNPINFFKWLICFQLTISLKFEKS